jgi:epoxyqueuosine reductase QueG
MENGKKAKMPKQEALEDADFDAIEATCPDLSTVGTRLTPEQIERLVESRGDPEIVDAVFDEAYEVKKERSPKPVAKPATKKVVEEEDIPEEKIVKAAPKPAPKVEAKVEVKADEDDEEAILAAQLAAIKAKKAAKAAAAFKPLPDDVEVAEKPLKKAPPVEEPQAELSPDVDPDKLPDDQFVSVFGKRK